MLMSVCFGICVYCLFVRLCVLKKLIAPDLLFYVFAANAHMYI